MVTRFGYASLACATFCRKEKNKQQEQNQKLHPVYNTKRTDPLQRINKKSTMANDTNSSFSNSSFEKIMARLPASDCIPWLIVLITESLAIVILNIITIIVFVKQRKLQRRSTYLIIHLAIVDLLVGGVSGPLQIQIYMAGSSMATDNNSSQASNSSYARMMARLPASDCIPWLVVLTTECLAIVILNIITIIVFVKQRKLQRRSTYLIIHLAIVDLLVGAVSGPLQIENLSLGI
ncbi:hypothetical protein ACROYT_G017385 [Oculina patagonica]